jgi:NAD(P)-dependent dehydrogenase (short-subunit alcohol dehydrogenase family)
MPRGAWKRFEVRRQESLRDAVIQEFERVDVLVGCASVSDMSSFRDGDIERWRRVLDTTPYNLSARDSRRRIRRDRLA